MEYVKICLCRVEDAAKEARAHIASGDMEKAKACLFDIDTWSKVAKADFKKAIRQ